MIVSYKESRWHIVTTFTVYAEERTMEQLQFDNAASFREAFVKSHVMERNWRLQPKKA
jgi:hypothetical protein